MRRILLPVVSISVIVTLLGAFTAMYLPATAAQEATPAGAECPTTTVDENKDLVSQVYEAIDSGDEAALAGLMADEVEFYTPSKGEREGSLANIFNGQQATFPDATVTVDLLAAEGDLVAAYTSWSGTAEGETAMFMGQEVNIPAGTTSEWVTSAFFRIECGKISEVWPVADRLGQLQDLGVITKEDLQVQGSASAATPVP
jgi:predicted ester cyclase